MHIILVAIGSVGDVHPLVGIGLALKKKGHSVVVLTSGYFESMMKETGLDVHPIGTAEDYLAVLNKMNMTAPFKLRPIICDNLFVRPMKPVYDYISAHHHRGNTVVVCSISAMGARLANEKLGVPMISINVSPMMCKSTINPPRVTPWENPRWLPRWGYQAIFHLVDTRFDREICPALNDFRKEIGLPPQRGVLQWVHSPDKIIGVFPDWYASPEADWPRQTELTGFLLFDEAKVNDAPLPAAVESFLKAGSPPILFTPGTPNKKAASFFQAAAEATMTLGRRAIFLTKYPEQVPSGLPPEILFLEYLPFSQVFPRIALLVHHGGIGTLAQALKAGLPQLIVPWGLDQYDNASRIKALGVGDELGKKDCHAAALADKIKSILDSRALHEKCAYYADKFKGADAIGDVCRIIETYGREKCKKT